jgi:hypothetical protein
MSNNKDSGQQQDNVVDLVHAQRCAMRRRVAQLIAAGFSVRDLGKKIGIGASTLSQWVREKYEHDDRKLLAKILEWVRGQDAAEAQRSWIPTDTGMQVVGALNRALGTGEMIAIYGGPGVGKTTAARYFAKAIAPWLVTCSPATSGLIPALQAVASKVGVVADGGAARISDALRTYLRNAPGILILDEAQHLSIAAVEELRAIHDDIDIGLVLMGNEHSYTRFVGHARVANFAQIRSRFGLCLHLPQPSSEDVHAIAKAWSIKDQRLMGQLEEIARKPGALRSVTKVLQLVRAIQDGKVTEEDINAAYRSYGAEV